MSPSASSVDTAYFTTLVGREAACRLLQRAGLLDDEGAPPPRLDMVTFWRLCAENIHACDDESHGVASQPVPRGSLTMLFTAAAQADDLNEALQRFADAARLVRKECVVSVSRGHDLTKFTVAPTEPGDLRAEIYAECFLIVAHCAFRWMTDRPLEPAWVRGAACLKSLGGALLLAPHAPVIRRGEGASVAYRAADASAPILNMRFKTWGDAEFHSFVELLGELSGDAETRSVTERAVLEALRAGLRSQEEIADQLGISPPTLRRRLAEGGTSFRDLSGAYRADELKALLATDLPLEEIAARLGLSDDRSLRRFGVEQLGVAPSDYRRQLASKP